MSRRVALFVATSLDGYIAGADGDLSWRFHDGDYGYAAFYARVDTLLMGRHTYEATLASPAWPHAGRKTVVFSRRGEGVVASPDTVVTDRAPRDVIGELRGREGGLLWLVGGAGLTRTCLDDGLVDDIIVSVHPVLLGSGTPLVRRGARATTLTLVGERRYPSGLMQLAYRVEPDVTPDSAAPPA